MSDVKLNPEQAADLIKKSIARLDDLTAENSQLTAELERLKGERDELIRKMMGLEAERNELLAVKQDRERLKGENERLKSEPPKFIKLDETTEQIQRETAYLDYMKESQKQQRELHELNHRQKHTIHELKSENAQLRTEVESQKHCYKLLDEERERLHSRVTELEAEVEDLMRVDYWQDRYKIAEARVKELEELQKQNKAQPNDGSGV